MAMNIFVRSVIFLKLVARLHYLKIVRTVTHVQFLDQARLSFDDQTVRCFPGLQLRILPDII